MFGIDGSEFLIIAIVAVLVLGPEHLPRVTRTFARIMSEFRRVSTEFQRTLNLEAHQQDAYLQRQQEQAAALKKKKKKKIASAEDNTDPAAPGDVPATDMPVDELAVENTLAAVARAAGGIDELAAETAPAPQPSAPVPAPETPPRVPQTPETGSAFASGDTPPGGAA